MKWLTLFGLGIVGAAVLAAARPRSPASPQNQATTPPVIQEVAEVSVRGPRPLAQAAELLEQKFGVAVAYEDGMWTYPPDVIRAADALEANRRKPDSLVPAWGLVEVHFYIDKAKRRPLEPETHVLQDLLEDHARRGNAGEFRILHLQDDFSIVPNRVHDQTGRLVPHSSPLEVRINLAEEERTGLATITAIIDALQEASGRSIIPGDMPNGYLSGTVVRVGATNQPARNVLIKALRGLRDEEAYKTGKVPKISWQLLYEPELRFYALNLRGVQAETPTPFGKTRLMPVYFSVPEGPR